VGHLIFTKMIWGHVSKNEVNKLHYSVGDNLHFFNLPRGKRDGKESERLI